MLFLVELDGAGVGGGALALALAVVGEFVVVGALQGVELAQADGVGGDGDGVVAVGGGPGGLGAVVVVVAAEVGARAFVGGRGGHGEGEGGVLFVADPEGVLGEEEIFDVGAEGAGTALWAGEVDQVGWDGRYFDWWWYPWSRVWVVKVDV